MVVDDILTRFGRTTIRQRPLLYLRWVRESFRYGLDLLPQQPWVLWPFALLVCSLPLLVLRSGIPTGAGDRATVLLAILVVALSYFALYLTLVSLVSLPYPRFFAGISLFVPMFLTASLFETWRAIIESYSRSPERRAALQVQRPGAEL